MADTDLLQPSILRQIGDKLYEKRKAAALEVEQIVKRLAQQNDKNRIRLIIDKLIGEYAFSTQSNNRKACNNPLTSHGGHAPLAAPS
ncbi:uncharacterized protein HaLaN_30138 [Haematococcus lacustris]|uniref:Uncharacterized protein n=1 Tax=Haematococcus lacustris TaxID=44745 RepID=A0A6A0AER2_HAELA|nr:uncharacterized protein HaLaN_30138 [Haematococcus lacustris]